MHALYIHITLSLPSNFKLKVINQTLLLAPSTILVISSLFLHLYSIHFPRSGQAGLSLQGKKERGREEEERRKL